MNGPHLYLFKSSRVLLIRLMVAHFIGTIFAYTVYINISSLGDGYRPETFEGFDVDFGSTLMVHAIYAYLGVFLPGFLAPMALGLVVATLTWHAFRNVYKHINPKLFWACNLFPHFLVWSGSSSKEQIVIICGIIVINFVVKNLFTVNKLNINIIFVIISLLIIYIIRPNYLVIYFTIFITPFLSPLLYKMAFEKFTPAVWIAAFTLVIFVTTFILSIDERFFSEDVVLFMKYVEISFLSYTTSNSNRTDIQWNDISDFIYHAPWGIVQGFIGPTLLEVILKPIQFPAFLEGVFYLCILWYLFIKLFKIASTVKMLRVHIMPYFFGVVVILFISYPYLIFNPGSALRYKQSLHPILIFYPLLIMAYVRANNLMKN